MGGVKITPFLTVMNAKDRKELQGAVNDQFGVHALPDKEYVISNKEKVYMVSPELRATKWESLRIDRVGVYIGKWYADGFRPSVEGANMLGPRASKNIVELGRQGLMGWFKGRDVETIHDETKFVLVKHGEDWLGAAKMQEGTLLNGVSKARKTVTLID
jgi:NOL1/NOP2/fmu family ribosome biogenesis protein